MKCPDCYREMTRVDEVNTIKDFQGNFGGTAYETQYQCVPCENEKIKMDDRKAKYQQEGDEDV